MWIRSAEQYRIVLDKDPGLVEASLGYGELLLADYQFQSAADQFQALLEGNPPHKEKDRAIVGLGMARFGLEEYADSRVEKLSSGMKQKVSMARTVAHDPPVLIFDEPTVALDVLNALELYNAIGGDAISEACNQRLRPIGVYALREFEGQQVLVVHYHELKLRGLAYDVYGALGVFDARKLYDNLG